MTRSLIVCFGLLSFSAAGVYAENGDGTAESNADEIVAATKQLNSESFKEREQAEARLNELGKKLIKEVLAGVEKPGEDATSKEVHAQYQAAEKLVADRLKTDLFKAITANATSDEAGQRGNQIRNRLEDVARIEVARKFSARIMNLWLAGRSGKTRAAMLKKGGNEKSEAAVATALAWIVKQQKSDGSWTYSTSGPCANAATGLSLMALLGAGNTHVMGAHAKSVDRGVRFLVKKMAADGSLVDPKGRMYSQGIAALALVEAYGMTHDAKLKAPAQKAIDFIVDAQDPTGGGWRYTPRMKGDTSVLGWQLAALQTARAAKLKVPDKTFKDAGKFLDSVAAEGGSQYGYTTPASGRAATTSIGLLGRVYLGSKLDAEGIVKGNKWLADQGPPTDSLYAMFFAHEFMQRFGGKNWEAWNTTAREVLVARQTKSGPERGSWDPTLFRKDHGSQIGGRLYVTSMAALNLEVYYRNGTIVAKTLK